MPGINFYEFLILIVLALVLLGPERLPIYAQTLARWVRRARHWADDAKVRFREETGTDFDEVDWQKYDPRQYDPRRIIREALADEYEDARAAMGSVKKSVDPVELFSTGSAGGETPLGSPRGGPHRLSDGTGPEPRGSRPTAAASALTPKGPNSSALAAGVAGSAAAGLGAGQAPAEADADPLATASAPYDTEAT
ncbi:Sec-independent protein translocase TatB [Nesterenkonia alkaliphila]|uniref:Sec-independent protein translocase TatB n=1 Tax=Nesterenkonia alkaliphila TaxID=1463631 RepID=A0A7K1UHJ0_9MICC|nr:Sec-independent protein translocase TatB [Nesterenkonia alkaliphila]MVT25854.1 Sec-independent protein translocase TatB [Nesterenkonia alkaliphila]GFZ76617.1 hypothetical protein GCM10011359_00700 [Nesterenkonia alkaliphila]